MKLLQVRLPDELYKALKLRSVNTGQTMQEMVSRLVEEDFTPARTIKTAPHYQKC